MATNRMRTYRPIILPTEPGMEAAMIHLSNLYLDAGIVSNPPTPALPNPASTPFAAYETKGLPLKRGE